MIRNWWRFNGVLALLALVGVMMVVGCPAVKAAGQAVKAAEQVCKELQIARDGYKDNQERLAAEHIRTLEALKVKLGKDGRVDDAFQVKEEIEKLKDEQDAQLFEPIVGNSKSKAVGKWSWPSGSVELKAGGKAIWTGGLEGTWEEKDSRITVLWSDGQVAELRPDPTYSKAALKGRNGEQYNIRKLDK